MAKIEAPPPSTISAIWKAREDAQKSRDSVGINMSELGSECDRQLWYNFRWTSEPEVFTGKKLRIFERGNNEELRLLEDLRRACIEVVEKDPSTGEQWRVYSHGGHVRGKLDAEAHNVPECPGEWVVVECKSHNDKNFKEVVKHGIQHAKPAHYMQCQKYMQLRSKAKCLYICTNMNDEDLHREIVEYDVAALRQLNARIDRIIHSNEAPAKISEKPDKYPCIFCKHKPVCSKQEFGRVNCRTCIHSTPVVIEGATEPTWQCENHDIELPLEQQKHGCREHRFLPDVVPGEQVDADDDWILYEMADGQHWTDEAV